jgi:hypothetical protein
MFKNIHTRTQWRDNGQNGYGVLTKPDGSKFANLYTHTYTYIHTHSGAIIGKMVTECWLNQMEGNMQANGWREKWRARAYYSMQMDGHTRYVVCMCVCVCKGMLVYANRWTYSVWCVCIYIHIYRHVTLCKWMDILSMLCVCVCYQSVCSWENERCVCDILGMLCVFVCVCVCVCSRSVYMHCAHRKREIILFFYTE